MAIPKLCPIIPKPDGWQECTFQHPEPAVQPQDHYVRHLHIKSMIKRKATTKPKYCPKSSSTLAKLT